jgi:hypothetical protein
MVAVNTPTGRLPCRRVKGLRNASRWKTSTTAAALGVADLIIDNFIWTLGCEGAAGALTTGPVNDSHFD